MSAHGELRRIAIEMAEFLEAAGDHVSRRLAADLRAATELIDDDICGAAERILETLSDSTREAAPSDSLRDAFERHLDHLNSISRVILGR